MFYLFALSVLVIIVVSIFTEKPDEEKLKGLTFSTMSAEDKKVTRESWDNWDVIHSVIIVSIIIGVYIYFW